MANDRGRRLTQLVEDLAAQYGRLDEAGIDKFARAVPSGLFLAVDRLANFRPPKGPTTSATANAKAPKIGVKTVAKKAPSIGTKRVRKAPAKKTAAKRIARG
jgi:hypothetical protein